MTSLVRLLALTNPSDQKIIGDGVLDCPLVRPSWVSPLSKTTNKYQRNNTVHDMLHFEVRQIWTRIIRDTVRLAAENARGLDPFCLTLLTSQFDLCGHEALWALRNFTGMFSAQDLEMAVGKQSVPKMEPW